MTFNSIYGTLFRVPSNDNILNLNHLSKKNLPEFFLKLISKSKRQKENPNEIKNNNNNNSTKKYDNKKNLKKSDKFNINNKSITNNNSINNNILTKKEDIFHRKKFNLITKRNLSESYLLNKRKDNVKDNDFFKQKEKEWKKKKENDNADSNQNKNLVKLKPQINNTNKNNINDNINPKSKRSSKFPNLTKTKRPTKSNDKQRYQKKFKENYAKLRNFLNHLYFIKKKYKLYNTLSPNLILSNTKNNFSQDLKTNNLKEQVSDLMYKFGNLNDLNENNSINLYIVNICSPINNFEKDILSLSRSVFFSKFNLDKNNNSKNFNNSNSFCNIQNKEKVNKIISPVIKKSKNNSGTSFFNPKKSKNKNNNNTKKYNQKTLDLEILKKREINRNNNSHTLIKSKSINQIEYIKHMQDRIKQYNLMSRTLNQANKGVKFPLIRIENFREQFSTDEEIEKLFSKEMIEMYFYQSKKYNLKINSLFLRNDKYYYKLNKMYYDQLSLYMEHRLNWELIENNNIDDDNDSLDDEPKSKVNFEWKYYSNRLYYKKYKYNSTYPIKKLCAVNLFEKNYEIGNKKKMFIHLINYCDKVNLNVFNYVPFTIIVNNTRFIEDELESFKEIYNFVEYQQNKTDNILNNDSNIIVNRKYIDQFWHEEKIENIQKQYIFINKNFLSPKNYWILKPTDLYQGKCIEISNSYEEIYKKCKNLFRGVDKRVKPELEDDEKDNNNNEYSYNNNEILTSSIDEENEYDNLTIKKKKKISNIYISNELIIQKYLDNPLLYRKRKFDIRCFVLVDWNLNVFFCREGHLKASSLIYDINNVNKFIHITNHSFQKKSNKFEKYECGNEISYNEFKNFLKEENVPSDYFAKIINKMKFLVELSFKAVGEKLIRTPDVLSFELFGYDFIIDNEYNPWILEINNNPGLSISSPVIAKIIPRMMDDAFRLTIDKIFNTQYSSYCFDSNGNYISRYHLDGYSDNENIFEFLCNVKDNVS